MKRFISALCVFLSLMTICSFAMAAEPIGSEFHDDRIWYLDRNSGLYGYLDTKGNVAIKSQFKTPVDFSDGLIPYYDGSTRRYGYMAEDGTMIFKPQFAKAGSFFIRRRYRLEELRMVHRRLPRQHRLLSTAPSPPHGEGAFAHMFTFHRMQSN